MDNEMFYNPSVNKKQIRCFNRASYYFAANFISTYSIKMKITLFGTLIILIATDSFARQPSTYEDFQNKKNLVAFGLAYAFAVRDWRIGNNCTKNTSEILTLVL